MKHLILFSSAASQGNTAQLVSTLHKNLSYSGEQVDIVNLDEHTITPYNYENQYPQDDFYPLVEKLLHADSVIWASPVYWSAVTAPMKAFIDRITELTDVPELKSKGRALAGKSNFVLATSASDEISSIFLSFFEQFFKYFNMEFNGVFHASCKEGFVIADKREFSAFVDNVSRKKLVS